MKCASALALFFLLGMAACSPPAQEEGANANPGIQSEAGEEARPNCESVVLWRPQVSPGYLISFNAEALHDGLTRALDALFEEHGADINVTEYTGFVVVFRHSGCQHPFQYIQEVVADATLALPMEDEVVAIDLIPISTGEIGERTLEEFNRAYVEWDAKLLGLPAISTEEVRAAGPNGLGRCNVYGVLTDESIDQDFTSPRIDEVLFGDFIEASLQETNEGEYDFVPILHATGRVFGIGAFGDCHEAVERSVAFLDRTIARLVGPDGSRPTLTYHLFTPEQIDGRSERQIQYALENGLVAPEGRSNSVEAD